MEPLKIIDIIDHQNKYFKQQFLVLNRDPQYLYERKEIWLIGEDSGFFSFYKYDRPSVGFFAFAGRKFDIPLKNGSIEKAYGQWWDATPDDYYGLIYETGYGTLDSLSKCNVFCSVKVDRLIVDKWLAENKPSNNYNRYDKRHANFGKQIIVSCWGERRRQCHLNQNVIPKSETKDTKTAGKMATMLDTKPHGQK